MKSDRANVCTLASALINSQPLSALPRLHFKIPNRVSALPRLHLKIANQSGCLHFRVWKNPDYPWKRSRVRRRPRQEVEWQVRKSRTWYSKGKVHTPVYTHSGGASGRSGGEALPTSGGAFPECLKGMPWTVEWPPMSGRSEYGDLRCLITA